VHSEHESDGRHKNTYRAGPPVPTGRRHLIVDEAKWVQAATEPIFTMSSARLSGFNLENPFRARPPRDVSIKLISQRVRAL